MVRTPIFTTNNNTPSSNYTPPSNNSEYSSEYNDNWNRLINNAAENHEAGEISDNDDFIQGRALTMEDLEDTPSPETMPQPKSDWAERKMPPLPSYPKQILDINGLGTDPMMMETRNIKEYLEEDKKDNIAVLYNNKTYLTSRSIIEQQETDALVYECLEGDKKTFQNIVGNLPLYNIKKIGLDLTSDNGVGVEAEYIYISGIDSLLEDGDWQLYSIVPLIDKQLVSVISFNEAQKVGTALGSGVSALHCQTGQGGLAGIIVKAYPSITGGRKKRAKTVKRKKGKTMKKKTIKKGKTIKKTRK